MSMPHSFVTTGIKPFLIQVVTEVAQPSEESKCKSSVFVVKSFLEGFKIPLLGALKREVVGPPTVSSVVFIDNGEVAVTLFAIIATLTIFKIQFSNSSLTEIQKILYSLVNHKKGKLHKEILGKHINDQLANSDGSNNEFYSICMEKVNKWKQTQDKSIYCDDNEVIVFIVD